MDDIDAPTWADFTGPSPQITEDYFLKRNEKLQEYRQKEDVSPSSPRPPFLEVKKLDLNILENDTTDDLVRTPKKMIIPQEVKYSSSKKKNIVKDTTYENVLLEAMNNLQLSITKKKGLNKSCAIDSPAFKTPDNKRITRSMCAQLHKSIQNGDETSFNELVASICCDENKENHLDDKNTNLTTEVPCEHEVFTENESNDLKDTSPGISKPKDTPDKETEKSKETEEVEVLNKNESIEKKDVWKSKVVTEFTNIVSNVQQIKKKKPTALTGNAWHKQAKRQLTIKNQIHPSKTETKKNKFVSLAEAVNNYQRVTPQRFRNNYVKLTRTEQLRRMSIKLTRATSPALKCKNRARPITVLSTDEKEKQEMEQLRQNKIKSKPVPKSTLNKPAPLRKVEKKLITVPEPFKITDEMKKNSKVKDHPADEVKTSNLKVKDHLTTHPTFKKTVPTITISEDKGILVKNEEVLHFGIPLEPGKSKKKNTKIMPFSFEERNKQQLEKKEQKIKQLKESEQNKNKAEFHARPVPAAIKTPILSNNTKTPNSSSQSKKGTVIQQFSFEERHKEFLKKKEEKLKLLLKVESNPRIFKAHPAPEFKPVLVKGRSKENLMKKSQESLMIKPKNQNLIPTVKPKIKSLPISKNSENQENNKKTCVPKIMEPKCKIMSKAILSELNTDKRSRQRKEYDEKLKQKEVLDEEIKRKEEEARIKKEKSDTALLRKMTETKARPMPVYKPLQLMKSSKPLTDAQSPAWSRKNNATK